jgi:exopolysaccharide production protein ExoY
MKRCFDILLSLVALIVFFPFGLVIAFLIKIISEGPVFYPCPRVGKKGKPIRCWKFRTMSANASEKLPEILNKDPALREEWERFKKLKIDPRVTSIGQFLRRTSLDEWPQFWNVLKGDLSVVGPRPPTEEEVKEYYGEKAMKVLSVRPGLTGIWQTSGRNLLPFKERVLMDELYVDNHSFVSDLQIIFKTVPQIFFTKGAF